MFKRIVLKLSGEYLSGEGINTDQTLKHVDYTVADALVSDIANIVKKGVQTAIVIGGGNFWRGRDIQQGFDRAKADNMGMLASVMNGIFLSERFISQGIRAHIMTPFSIGGFTELFNQDTASDYLNEGHITIFPGGTGQPFFSTDTISIIRAKQLNACSALFAKSVPGVCSKDPRKYTDYTVYREITAQLMITENLTVIDVASMIIARDQNVKSALFDIGAKNAIETAVQGFEAIKQIGTVIIP